jgi:hypothetical protein
MKRKIISTQVKRYIIESPGWYCCGRIPPKIWAEGDFTTKKEAEAIYKKVLEKFNSINTLFKEPKLSYYWKEIYREEQYL